MAKMGRPKAENPKNIELRVCIDKDTEKVLTELAEHFNTNKSVIVRMGIEKLYAEIKK